jgi:hypothetical protein
MPTVINVSSSEADRITHIAHVSDGLPLLQGTASDPSHSIVSKMIGRGIWGTSRCAQL